MFPELIGESAAMTAVRAQLARLIERSQGSARLPPVLLQGETGTGKGLLARALHQASARRQGPLVDVNCAAIPEALLEAEMFGYERGAFTDARQAKAGLFQSANRGTLFLDEIGLLPETLQGKLLKAIEERTVRRLGATRAEPVDAWMIAATSVDLEAAVAAGRFRRDLYHRLAVVALRLPPLRERGEDVLRLAEFFLRRACDDYALRPKRLSGDAQEALVAHSWPGNVRELANVIERGALLGDGPVLTAEALELPDPLAEPAAGPPLRESLRSAERERLLAALEHTSWNLSHAAARLSLPRNTLLYRMERQGLRPPPPSRRRELPAERDLANERPARWRWLALLRLSATDDSAAGPGALEAALEAAVERVLAFGGNIEERSAGSLTARFDLEPGEDAARRAALAAMAAQRALARESSPDGTLKLRAAIHVAELPVGGAADAMVDGPEKASACAALEATAAPAEPGRLAASASAARWLERRFDLRPLPGTSEAAGTFEVSGPERHGFELAGRATAFTGRRQELALLQSRLDAAAERRGHVVAIMGDPGLGKSRLLAQFRQATARRPVTWRSAECSSHATAIPFLPISALLREACQITEEDGAAQLAAKVERALEEAGGAGGARAGWLLRLLDADAAPDTLPNTSAERSKIQMADVFRQLVLGWSRTQPVIVCVEDLHWIDKASEEVLAALVDGIPAAAVLIVVTYRPGYRPPWLGQAHVTQLALPPLSLDDSLLVLRSALAEARLPADALTRLAERADGNPFFLEELARDLDEHGEAGSIPETVRAALGGRIERLGLQERRTLQASAVIGREVPAGLLSAVTGVAESALRPRLERLRAAGFLYETGPRAGPGHTFKHALTQEVAYATLDADERRELHGRVADALRAASRDSADPPPEVLAGHLTAAGQGTEAIPHWLRAGRSAVRRSANVEAVRHLQTALALLSQAPPSPDHDRLELELLLALGPPLVMTHGYASEEVESAYLRAEALCAAVCDPPQLFAALWGISIFHVVRGDLRAARAVAARLLDAALRAGSDDLELEARLACGAAAFHEGALAEARAHLERTVALYEPVRHGAHAFSYGQDPCVAALGFLGRTLLVTGHDAEGGLQVARAMRIAQAVDHPFTRAFSLLNAAQYHELRRDFTALLPYTEDAVALASEHHFPLLLGAGLCMRGQALVAQRRFDEGLRAIQEGVSTWRATGAGLSQAYYLGVLADAFCAAGDRAQGLAHVEQALPLAERNGERVSLPELHRIHGELLSTDPERGAEAQAAFERAIALARGQGAALFARHAAAGLSAHLRREGRHDDADRLDEDMRAGFRAP